MKIVDLFCGAGGLSVGFHAAGAEVVAAYDNWAPAVETYRRNLGDHVHKMEVDAGMSIPTVDVIAGGPPCQGFSSAGARREGDPRNSLVGVFAAIVARHQPKAFVFENVEGFLTGDGGFHVLELLRPVIAAGYRVHLRKINAANFGVPQNRKRVLAIGGLGWSPSFPKSTHSTFGIPGARNTHCSWLPPTPTVRDAISHLRSISDSAASDHVRTEWNGIDRERALHLSQGQSMRDLPKNLWHPSFHARANRRVMDGTPTEKRGGAPAGIRRLRYDEPSKAVTGAAMRDFVHPEEVRPLTIRECATLQTFPADFAFCGSQVDRIQLIGNAVPPRLATVLAESLLAQLPTQVSSPSTPGELLSFVPTLADAMSPALRKVVNAVSDEFQPTSMRLMA